MPDAQGQAHPLDWVRLPDGREGWVMCLFWQYGKRSAEVSCPDTHWMDRTGVAPLDELKVLPTPERYRTK